MFLSIAGVPKSRQGFRGLFQEKMAVFKVRQYFFVLYCLLNACHCRMIRIEIIFFHRLVGSKRRENKNSIDWTFSSIVHTEAMTSDVIAPSPWKIFGCQNGKD